MRVLNNLRAKKLLCPKSISVLRKVMRFSMRQRKLPGVLTYIKAGPRSAVDSALDF